MRIQIPLFPDMEPPGMWMRCDCGNKIARSHHFVSKLGYQPSDAVSMWSDSCDQCYPNGLHVWGWVLEDGTLVSCHGGPNTVGSDSCAIAILDLVAENHRLSSSP